MVQKVMHNMSGNIYALKRIKKEVVIMYDLQEQLLSEVRTQIGMRHPCILGCFDYFEDHCDVCLVLEYAPEGDLFRRLRKGSLPEAEAARIFEQIADGLDYLHRQDIAHRDLKPENIMLFPDLRAKIADFGCCAQTIRRETIVGTLSLMAPEMIHGGGYDCRVDIWSLGILLFEMLVGSTPFSRRAGGLAETYERILHEDLTSTLEKAPKGARQLLSRLLERDPGRRISLERAMREPWVLAHCPHAKAHSTKSETETPLSERSTTYGSDSVPPSGFSTTGRPSNQAAGPGCLERPACRSKVSLLEDGAPVMWSDSLERSQDYGFGGLEPIKSGHTLVLESSRRHEGNVDDPAAEVAPLVPRESVLSDRRFIGSAETRGQGALQCRRPSSSSISSPRRPTPSRSPRQPQGRQLEEERSSFRASPSRSHIPCEQECPEECRLSNVARLSQRPAPCMGERRSPKVPAGPAPFGAKDSVPSRGPADLEVPPSPLSHSLRPLRTTALGRHISLSRSPSPSAAPPEPATARWRPSSPRQVSMPATSAGAADLNGFETLAGQFSKGLGELVTSLAGFWDASASPVSAPTSDADRGRRAGWGFGAWMRQPDTTPYGAVCHACGEHLPLEAGAMEQHSRVCRAASSGRCFAESDGPRSSWI